MSQLLEQSAHRPKFDRRRSMDVDRAETKFKDSTIERFFSDNFKRKLPSDYNKLKYVAELKHELGRGGRGRLSSKSLFTKSLPCLDVILNDVNQLDNSPFRRKKMAKKSKNDTRIKPKNVHKKSILGVHSSKSCLSNSAFSKEKLYPMRINDTNTKRVKYNIIRKNCNNKRESYDKQIIPHIDDSPNVHMLNPEMSSQEVLYDIEHDWMRNDDYSKRLQKVRQSKRDLDIPMRHNKSSQAIETRVNEVKRMVKPNAQIQYLLENMNPRLLELVQQFDKMPLDEAKAVNRKKWSSPIDKFRGAARLCVNLLSAFMHRKRYLNANSDTVLPPLRGSPEMVDSITHKSTLRQDTVEALITIPRWRDETHKLKICRVLRATKAFDHLFPAELDTQLADVVAYDRYEDKRVIANQQSIPDRFYYVISGKILLVREYHLDAGTVIKQIGELTKGMTTDSEEMEQQWLREFTLVAKGHVEALVVHKTDYMRLIHHTSTPPLAFLQNVHLFKEFPCERLNDSKDSFECRYYGENKMILGDASCTPWIYVVKSGEVKVVRVQEIRDSNHVTTTVPRNLLGLDRDRSVSHADAMLGCLAYQRKMKSKNQKTPLSVQRRENTVNPLIETILPGDISVPAVMVRAPTDENIQLTLKKSSKSTALPPINIPVQPLLERQATLPSMNSQIAFLTRERTEKTFVDNKLNNHTKTARKRSACLQLDVLKPGDVFGVEALVGEIRRKQGLPSRIDSGGNSRDNLLKDLSLVSGGAEVIKINKRLFLQHAANNTMLKIETMQREYMTKDEAETKLGDAEKWNIYKNLTLERTMTTLHVHRSIQS